MKQIIITEEENGETSLRAEKGTKWATFIVGIEMMIEEIMKDSNGTIDDVLEDIKRIYLKDKEENKWK